MDDEYKELLHKNSNDAYRAGFEEGYKLVKGFFSIPPGSLLQPLTPPGSTAFREGLKNGIEEAGGKIVEE